MQERVTKITQWIIDNDPILLSGQSPTAANPFGNLPLPKYSDYSGNRRLGFIYQELCKRLFEQHPDFEVLAEEVQLFNEKETIGAIDFLLAHQDQIEHWEVAIKFYLLKDGLWYGPDSRDRLDIKLHRMLNHQLKMSKNEAFLQRFPDVNDVTPHMLIHGRLYTNPFDQEAIPDHCLSYKLNPSSIIGFWCYQHQLPLLKEPLYKLQKLDWIPGTHNLTEKLTSMTEYSVHCQNLSGEYWIVVPNHWPEHSYQPK